MGLLASLVTDETVVAECRRCGTAIDCGATACPVCESEEIAEYTVS
jgi:RNA polymerase subunit RPABC4/transcription elongation factor Spt4